MGLDSPYLSTHGALGQVQARRRAGHGPGGCCRLEGLEPTPGREPPSHRACLPSRVLRK